MRRPEIKWVLLAFFILLFLTSESFSWVKDEKSSLYEVKLEREPLVSTIGGQADLSNSLGWKDFIARNGWWDVEWNELKKTPYSAYGRGIQIPGYGFIDETNAEAAAKEFLQENSDLFEIEVVDLELTKKRLVVGKWYVSFRQKVSDIPVYGSEVELRMTQTGKVFLFRSNFHPQIELSLTPSISQSQAVELAKSGLEFNSETDQVLETQLIILPIEKMDKIDYRLTYRVRMRTKDPVGDWICWVDALTGELLWRYNDIKFSHVFGTVTGDMYPMYMTDPKAEKPFIFEQVNVAGVGSDITDTSGFYDLLANPGSYTVSSELKGPYVNVNYEDGPDAFYSNTVVADLAHDWKWDETMGLMDELNVYYHVQVIHSYVKKLDPGLTALDYEMPANVRVGTNYNNAYWDGYSINFGEGSGTPGGFYNFALFCDVIYHEYTHGITDFTVDWPYSGETGAMHEGFSDFFACTITDEPLMGEVMTVGQPYLRTVDNDFKMPDDWVGQVHHDGMIISGALWDLREALGASLTDSLAHFSRYGNPRSFDECYEEMLVVDDDDGDLSNGTPHIAEITVAFWKHGIGPGPFVNITHTPLKDTSDTTNAYRVEASIFSINPLDPDSIFVYYSTGADFSPILMQPTGNPGEYAAEIPPQPLLTRVDYYIFAQDTSGVTGTSPEGTPEYFYSFFVQLPPQISVSVDSVSTTLYAGDSTQKKFIIKNVGQGYLNFLISHFSGGSFGQSIMQNSSPQIPGMEPSELEQILTNTNTFETSEQNLVTPHTFRAQNSPVLVALFKDYDPWNNPANEYILQAQGISYDVYNSNSMGIVDLSPYDKVITASVQGSYFWNNLSSNRTWFDEYVSRGGTLEMHLASNSAALPGLMLPGGLVVSSFVGYDNVTIKDTDHPFVTTPNVITDAELDGWNASAHGHLATIPIETNVIIEDAYTYNPLCVDFSLGGGGILATTQTVEWYNASPAYLENMILYTTGVSWLSFSPDSGLIAPGDSIEITVDINASSLRCDTTISDTFIINSNDPDPSRDTLFIPLTLTVLGVPDIAVSDSIILFDEIIADPFCQPEADTDELWIYNEGCDSVLTVKMILSDTTNFSILSPDSFNIAPGGSYPLLIYFKPQIGGSITETVTLLSNDLDEDTVIVTLNGIGLWASRFALSDSLLDLSLYPDQDTTIELLIYNIDRGLLEFKVTKAKQKVDSVGVVGENAYSLTNRLNNDYYLSTFYHFINLGYDWSYQDIEPYDLILVDENAGSFDCSEAVALRDFYYSGKPVILGMNGLHFENSCERESVYTVFGVRDAVEGYFYPGYLNPLHPISRDVILNPCSPRITHLKEDGATWVVAGDDGNYYVLAKDDLSKTVIFGYRIYYWWDNCTKQLIKNAIDWISPRWLSIFPFYPDSIPPYESSIIDVIINTSELDLDSSYHDTLIIETNNCETPTFTVPLHLEVVCPWICSIPESVVVSAQEGEVDTTQILVSNCGGGTLIFGVEEDLDWIEVHPEEDSVSSGDTVRVDVVADFSDLLPGDYFVGLGILSYTCSGDSFVVLHYNVGPCPDILVFPESLSIDSLYPKRYKDTTISLGNQGLGTLWFELSNRISGGSAVFGLGGEPAQREYEESYYGQDLGKGEEDYRVGSEVVYNYGGPDDFGYHWIDSDDLEGPEFEWVEISRIGRRIEGLSLDNNVGPFYLGFSFPFYDEEYDSVRICSNGWLSFSSTLTSYTNQPLPYPGGPYDLLAMFWDDLDFTSGGSAYYFTDGRRFVVEYKDVSHFGGMGNYTFQIILYTDGRIKYQYLSMEDPKDKATVGIQNSDGTDGLEVVFNTPYLKDSLAILISASVPWISVAPARGTIESPDSVDVGIKFSAPSVAGEYKANLLVSSNDCDQILDSIPMNINVVPCSVFFGDMNADCWADISDAIHLINYLFNDGPSPNPEQTGDVNCDGSIGISDVVYLINYLFKGGSAPGDPDDDGIPNC